MKIVIKNTQGADAGEYEVKFPLITDGKGTQAVHDTVVAHLANRRSGTACTKTMGDVNGTGKKPWRQKGTGRARAGSFASPLWRGGGVVFGPKPRDFSKKVNDKTRALALRKAISERLKAGEVIVVESIQLAAPKSREFAALLQKLGVTDTVLLVTDTHDEALHRASRNVVGVESTTSSMLNTYLALKPSRLLFTRAAFEHLEKRLNPE